MAIFIAGCTAVSERKPTKLAIPYEFKDGVELSFNLAGENASEIKKFLHSVKKDRLSAAAFLVANMPPSALASLTSEDLLSEFRLAYRAREEFPWGKKLPERIFLHFVLPNFVAQEPFERYREYLYPLLKKTLKGCRTAEEAALELNRWCGKRFTYRPTQARDQGVFESLKRGYGRCEEMMILYIAAARTVSLPARVAATPLWSTCDSNHAWVEVFCNGKWYYLGACEPADSLNTAWFTNTAKRAPLVLARVYGKYQDLQEGEEVYQEVERSSLINTTRWYSKTSKVRVRVTDGRKPLKGAEVFFSVFNFGGIRPFAKIVTDSDGVGELTVGIGEFIVSTSVGKRYAILRLKTEPNKEEMVELRVGEQDLKEGFFWLRYPEVHSNGCGRLHPPERRFYSCAPSEINDRPNCVYGCFPSYLPQQESLHPDEFSIEKDPVLAERIKSLGKEKADALIKKLKEAAGNWRTLASAIKKTKREFEEMVELLLCLSPLEVIETDEQTLLEHLYVALKVREETAWKYNSEDFIKYLLSPHILYAPLRKWRKALKERLGDLRKDTIAETAKAVNEWVAKSIKPLKDRLSYCGWFKTPYEVMVSGYGSKGEIIGFTVGLLRALGVAARPHPAGWVEFSNGKEWLPLYPLEPKRFASKTATEKAKREYAKKGRLIITILHKGAPACGFKSFSVQQIGDKGYFKHIWYPDNPPDKDGRVEIELPPDDYRLFAGVRNRNGEPYIYHKKIKIESNKAVSLTLKLDIPYEEWEEKDWCVREFKKTPEVQFVSLDGRTKVSFRDAIKEGVSLVVFFRLENEPPRRMLPLLIEWSKKNDTDAFFVYIGEADLTLTKFIKEQKIKVNIMLLSEEEAKRQLSLPYSRRARRFKRLPQTLLFKNGRLILWQEGFDMSITEALDMALKKR